MPLPTPLDPVSSSLQAALLAPSSLPSACPLHGPNWPVPLCAPSRIVDSTVQGLHSPVAFNCHRNGVSRKFSAVGAGLYSWVDCQRQGLGLDLCVGRPAANTLEMPRERGLSQHSDLMPSTRARLVLLAHVTLLLLPAHFLGILPSQKNALWEPRQAQ